MKKIGLMLAILVLLGWGQQSLFNYQIAKKNLLNSVLFEVLEVSPSSAKSWQLQASPWKTRWYLRAFCESWQISLPGQPTQTVVFKKIQLKFAIFPAILRGAIDLSLQAEGPNGNGTIQAKSRLSIARLLSGSLPAKNLTFRIERLPLETLKNLVMKTGIIDTLLIGIQGGTLDLKGELLYPGDELQQSGMIELALADLAWTPIASFGVLRLPAGQTTVAIRGRAWQLLKPLLLEERRLGIQLGFAKPDETAAFQVSLEAQPLVMAALAQALTCPLAKKIVWHWQDSGFSCRGR
jgi:hypothetical protein